MVVELLYRDPQGGTIKPQVGTDTRPSCATVTVTKDNLELSFGALPVDLLCCGRRGRRDDDIDDEELTELVREFGGVKRKFNSRTPDPVLAPQSSGPAKVGSINSNYI